MYLNIIEAFKKLYEDLRKERRIEDASLSKPAQTNLHSWLEYALVIAAERVGLRGAPEIKLRYSKPLDPKQECGVNKRRRKHCRVDVAFYKSSNLVGIAEIHTINDAMGYLSTKEFAKTLEEDKFSLSDRDVLMYTIQHSESKPKFVIILVTLPKRASRIPWLTYIEKVAPKIANDLRRSRNFYEHLGEGWIKLRDDVEKEVRCSLAIINEDGLEVI